MGRALWRCIIMPHTIASRSLVDPARRGLVSGASAGCMPAYADVGEAGTEVLAWPWLLRLRANSSRRCATTTAPLVGALHAQLLGTSKGLLLEEFRHWLWVQTVPTHAHAPSTRPLFGGACLLYLLSATCAESGNRHCGSGEMDRGAHVFSCQQHAL